MPSIADIIVKKNDGTTDTTYVAKIPSSGDLSPAVWKLDAIGASPQQRPELRESSTGNGDVRRLKLTYRYPHLETDVASGIVTVKGYVQGSMEFIVPQNVVQTTVDEAASQFANLIASTTIKTAMKQQYAHT
jgi:hypothetical protein